MHIVYFDESRDEKVAVVSGLAVPASTWEMCLASLRQFRHELKAQDGIFPDKELHAFEFVAGRGKIAEGVVPKGRRCRLFKEALSAATTLPGVRAFVTHSSPPDIASAFGQALTRVNQAMSVWGSYAVLVCDEGNNDLYTSAVRHWRLRTEATPSESKRIIEDPFFRDSRHSLFIQLVDFVAYARLRQLSPLESKNRYGLDFAFDLIRPLLVGEP